ncbi:stereocilin isoform X2 [Gouania willdenowi]|uniref:stereocilin isoform X2 n=1 Tax=Gouania willdenowi TaxID=441366 RepID=UPI0010544D6C|nr:stereocilin isoform X2 [Gouania willdenowi]
MKMEKTRSEMASLKFTSILVCVLMLGQGTPEKNGAKDDHKDTIIKEIFSRWSKKSALNPQQGTDRDQSVHNWMTNVVGGLKSLGLLSSKNFPSLKKPMTRHRLSSFLYNISMYLQEMGAELEETEGEMDEEQLWMKVLHFFLQSEGNAALNQWNGRVPPRPSISVKDWFISLRGSPHWDWLLGLLQSFLAIMERQPHKSFLNLLYQNWRTVSAVLEAALQAVISGTYGQASAGLQGFICALNGRNDCPFSVSWLQQLLQFLETQNWKPVVSVHHAGEAAELTKSSRPLGRLRPFSLPPEVMKVDGLSGNVSEVNYRVTEDEQDSMQSFLLQALSRSGREERGGPGNLALVQSLDGLRKVFLQRVGSSVYGNLRRKVARVTMAMLDDISSSMDVHQPNPQSRCPIGNLRQLILWGIRHNVMWNTQALGINTHGLPSSLPLLSCPPVQRAGRRSVKQNHLGELSALPHSSLSVQPQTTEDNDQQMEMEYSSAEILEAACNESIPGLTGVSNFTVFLYCKLFEGENGTGNSAVTDKRLDMHDACSDAAWYLLAAEDDFLWVQVCSEFFAHEFNNTVCANSSFLLQRAHQVALTKEYVLSNQTSIEDLCLQLSGEETKAPGLSENCLSHLSGRSLSAEAFRHCFFPNNTVLISSVCGGESPNHQVPEGSWAAAYCSKMHNNSHDDIYVETCRYRSWTVNHFTNDTLLTLCEQTPGLREHICLNVTLYQQVLRLMPQFADICTDLHAKQDTRKCFLQQVFDMLPAPYEFNTSQLCVDPNLLVEIFHKLSVCEMEGGDHHRFLMTLGYVLRMLDIIVGLSAGLEEGEREARQGLSQAILLSSLLDNTSWSILQPHAATSVLHSVGVFLSREQNASLKADLLSCFSPVLWDLIERDDNSSALRVLMQEYLQMPQDSIRTLVMSAEKDAVQRFLSHMHQSWDQLQVETSEASQVELQAMETMTAAFIHKFPRVTPELFLDLSQFIPFMSVSDIMSFPASLILNDSVLTAIRDHSSGMKSLQKKAFVKRILQSSILGDVPSWPPYFLSSILPLLPYLPVSHFQQLTSQQLNPLVELLGNSSLDGVRGRHVLRTITSWTKKNLTSESLIRLGSLVCYLDPADVGFYLQDSAVSSALWQQLSQCISKGFISANGRLSSWLKPAVHSLNVSSLSTSELSALSGLLSQSAASFLLSLPTQQLLEVLSQPRMHQYSPAQAFQLLSKISKDSKFTVEKLCRLKALHSGLSLAVVRDLQWSEISEASFCQCWRSLFTELKPKPGHRAMLYSAMQEVLHRSPKNISSQLKCLLPFSPLKKLMDVFNGNSISKGLGTYSTIHWSSHQAQFLFTKIPKVKNNTSKSLRDLGVIAAGISCDYLKLWRNDTDFLELLNFVSELPGGLRPSLRKCMVDVLRKQPEIDVNTLSSGFAATLPVTMIESLSNASLRAILDHIQGHFTVYLRLPYYKQTNLAEKILSAQGGFLTEERIDGALLDMIGPLLPFLDHNSLALVDRGALTMRLEEMRSFCLPREALRDISALLTQRDLLGEPSKWQPGDVEHLGRLVFALSTKQINSIPLAVLNKDVVEQVLQGQRRWEDRMVGAVCLAQCVDQHRHTQQSNSLLQGIVKARNRRAKKPVPSCADIRGTFPSAWTSTQLSRMSQEELELCVEVFGQDSSLNSEQRRSLWAKHRPFFSPVRELRAEQVLVLGSMVTEMTDRELQDLDLTDPGVVAHLGTLTDWSHKKMRVVLLSMMRSRRLRVEQLTYVDLATLGRLICGLYPSEMQRLNFSMAVFFLRETSLPCTEQQMEALTTSLSHPEAFGPISGWGPEVFTEMGTLAVGLPDMVLSALQQEQMEGITPEAIALIPPRKMAVVFSAVQLSWLSAEQAWAVSADQWAELGNEQKHAVGLARYEGDVLLELRGRNSAPGAQSRGSVAVGCLTLCILFWQLK